MSQLLYVPARSVSLSMCVLYVLLQLLQKVCAVPNEKCHVSVVKHPLGWFYQRMGLALPILAGPEQIGLRQIQTKEVEEVCGRNDDYFSLAHIGMQKVYLWERNLLDTIHRPVIQLILYVLNQIILI